MTKQTTESLRGTLDMLVLKSLTVQPMHGWGIGRWIQERSAGLLDLNQGSLYPALQRLEQRGWIESEWGQSENNRQARYYRLTPAGRRALPGERQNWNRFAQTVGEIMDATT